MSVATDGIHCLCPPRFPKGLMPDGRPMPRIFAEHRIEVFQALSSRVDFAHWQVSRDDDIGMMILEWAAGLLDNLSFYNHLWTLEQHIGTATQDASLRQLAAMTGYQPRTNLAATARLAVISDARAPFVLPKGIGVKSEGNDDHPALTFETAAEAPIDPALNAMTAIPPRETLFDPAFVALGQGPRNLRPDEPLLFVSGDLRLATMLYGIREEKFPSGAPYAELEIGRTLTEFTDHAIGGIEVMSFTSKLDGRSLSGDVIELPGIQPTLHTGHDIVALDTETGAVRHGTIETRTYVNKEVISSETNPVLSPVTQLTIDRDVPSGRVHTVFYGLTRAGRLTGAPKTHLALSEFGGRLPVAEKYLGDTLDYQGDFVVTDAERRSVRLAATLDVNPHTRRTVLDLTSIDDPDLVLKAPLTVHGNFAEVDQGQTTVETLGSAIGRRYQTFRLGKKPLTFLRRDESAPEPAIEVYVNSVPWAYVPHLYGVEPDDRVFTLQVEADGQAHVILGGLADPGDGNVAARYRHGTTGDNPLAFTINAPAGRIKGVQKVFNPFPALAGLTGDDADDLRFILAARTSANDRCVSTNDYTVLSRDFGALTARARAYWNPVRKRAGVEVIAVFDGGFDAALAGKLREYLSGHAPEGSLIDVVSAVPAPREIDLRIRMTDDARQDELEAVIRDIYFHEHTGLLAPRRARIGHAWTRAELLAPLDAIPGILRVERLALDGSEALGATPIAPDAYIDATLELELLR